MLRNNKSNNKSEFPRYTLKIFQSSGILGSQNGQRWGQKVKFNPEFRFFISFDDYKSLTIKMLLFLFIVIIVAKFDFYRVKECRLQVHTTGPH